MLSNLVGTASRAGLCDIHPGGIGEQHQRQSDLSDGVDRRGFDVDRGGPQSGLPRT